MFLLAEIMAKIWDAHLHKEISSGDMSEVTKKSIKAKREQVIRLDVDSRSDSLYVLCEGFCWDFTFV